MARAYLENLEAQGSGDLRGLSTRLRGGPGHLTPRELLWVGREEAAALGRSDECKAQTPETK